MVVALILVVAGMVLFDMRARLKAVEARLATLEGVRREPRSPVAARVVERTVDTSPDRPSALDYLAVPVSLRPDSVGRPSFSEQRGIENQEGDSTNSALTDAVDETPIKPKLEGDRPASPPEEPARISRNLSFEELFGRRLPIWAGGATLAVAGVLLVKYSIDAGLLSPVVRVVLGMLFGSALIGGAEAALRQEGRLRDARVRQALAGAGLATLYAAILAAHGLYGLIGPMAAFVGLAGVTALAMALSIRFGAPSALLGLVGGLAAPALVSAGQPNVPLLICYLALAIGGLCTLSRTQRWMWLGVGALAGGAGWGVAMLALGALDAAASVSVALLLIALGVALPLLAFSGARANGLRLVAAVIAAAQMAALVATGGFSLLNWGLFGLLSIALVWLGGRTPLLRPLGAVGLGIALFLIGAWPAPDSGSFTLVLAGLAAIFGGPALWRLWRAGGSLVEAGQLAAIALGALAVGAIHFYRPALDGSFALFALGAAILPASAMALGWRQEERRGDARFALLATAVALLLALSGGLAFPGWTLPVIFAAVAAALMILSLCAGDWRVEGSGWVFAGGAVAVLLAGGHGLSESARLLGEAGTAPVPQAMLRWAAVALVAGLLAWRARFAEGRLVAQALAALLGYGALAQVVPDAWLAVVPACALPVLAESARRLPERRLLPALGTVLLLSLGWAIWPIGMWAVPASVSLLGQPLLASALPSSIEALRRLALPALMIGVALWRLRGTLAAVRAPLVVTSVLLGGVALHIFYKQLFHLSGTADVVRFALAERTLWEGLLLGAAGAVWRFAKAQRLAVGLGAAALCHWLLYTALLHGPLWYPQAVGGLPLLTLLIPAFAIPFAALALIGRVVPDLAVQLQRPFDMLRMAAVLLLAYAMLRQLFAGSLLTIVPLGEVEDILRSVLAIGLAIGFLLWGTRSGARDWRIASLLLMLGAVVKVFLFDASGLHGLLRIGSFLALGFSLIGIGWFYNRVLNDARH